MIGGPSKINRYLLAGAGAIGILAAGVPAANAQDLKAIQAQIDSMQATIKSLQQQVEDAKAQASAAKAAAAEAGASDLDLKVKWKGAPEFSSGDGKKFKFKVRGRLEVDYNNVNQDTPITSFPDVSGDRASSCPPRRRRRNLVRLEIRCRSRFRQRRGQNEGRLSPIPGFQNRRRTAALANWQFQDLQHVRR